MNISKTLNKWHRRAGILSAVFVAILVITGIMLNHTSALNLDKRHVQNSLLLDLYNIHPASEPKGFRVNKHWVSSVGERVYLDDIEVASGVRSLVGAVDVNGEIAIAIDEQIIFVNTKGEVIERIGGTEGVPSGMRIIGITTDHDLVVNGSHGNYIADPEDLNWHEVTHINAVWSEAEPLPENILEHLLQLYRGKGLSVERVILDIHSGRILGSWGVYIIDIAAILFLLLAISGMWMWFRTPRLNGKN